MISLAKAREILGHNAWTYPGIYSQILTIASFNALMLATQGQLLINGELWLILHRELPNDTYFIWFEKRDGHKDIEH